jgi:hypothetical protein
MTFWALLVISVFAAATAESAPVLRLKWQAPATCPQQAEVLASVERRLGRALATQGAPLTVTAELMAVDDQRFLLRFNIDTAQKKSERSLKGSNCVQLADAGALIMALLIDPTLLQRQSVASADAVEPESASAQPVTSPPVVQPQTSGGAVSPAAEAAAEDSPSNEPALTATAAPWSSSASQFSVIHGRLRVAAVGDVGTLPRPMAGWRAAFAIDVGRISAEVFGGSFGGQRVPVDLGPGTSAWLSTDLEAGARACWVWELSWGSPMGCGAVALGQVSGRGEGITNPQTQRALFGTAFLGAGLRWTLIGRWALRADLEAGLPFLRPSFFFQGQPPLYQSSLVLGRADLGVEVKLW